MPKQSLPILGKQLEILAQTPENIMIRKDITLGERSCKKNVSMAAFNGTA